jgi:hypothetical protein
MILQEWSIEAGTGGTLMFALQVLDSCPATGPWNLSSATTMLSSLEPRGEVQ